MKKNNKTVFFIVALVLAIFIFSQGGVFTGSVYTYNSLDSARNKCAQEGGGIIFEKAGDYCLTTLPDDGRNCPGGHIGWNYIEYCSWYYNECTAETVGQWRCANDKVYICGQSITPPNQPVYGWSEWATCDLGCAVPPGNNYGTPQLCFYETCTDECPSAGAVGCDQDSKWVCGYYDTDDCLDKDWDHCPGDCQNGECVGTPDCGNSIVETDPFGTDEVCDPPGQEVFCTINGYDGLKTCASNCLSYSPCETSESCGDGICNGPETESTCAQDCIGGCNQFNSAPGDRIWTTQDYTSCEALGCAVQYNTDPSVYGPISNIVEWLIANIFDLSISPAKCVGKVSTGNYVLANSQGNANQQCQSGYGLLREDNFGQKDVYRCSTPTQGQTCDVAWQQPFAQIFDAIPGLSNVNMDCQTKAIIILLIFGLIIFMVVKP